MTSSVKKDILKLIVLSKVGVKYLYQGGDFMKCPYCSSDNTRVIDSRPADDNNAIRRRRLCDDCGKRFTTYEKVETIPLIVIKKDDNREQDRKSVV